MMRVVRLTRVVGIGLLASVLGISGAATAAGNVQRPAKETAASFAIRVLKEAAIPPGAHSTHRLLCGLLAQAATSVGISDLTDLHKLYLVAESPDEVESYLEAHLHPGAKMTSTGNGSSPQCTEEDVEVSLPTSGNNEYLAQLVYTFSPVGTGSELRIDSQTVWVPNRPAGEVVPTGGVMEVTGFSQTSAMEGSSGPVTVLLSNSQAAAIRAVFNALPRAPRVLCMEDSILFEITIRSKAGLPPFFTADGDECENTVVVTEHQETLPSLYDRNCPLLRAVAKLLPAKAKSTREIAGQCKTWQS
ncbi:MAG: hypothetical protein ABSD97_05650 [Acidimicrobiales bacterium]|jgi:hypothetical protein